MDILALAAAVEAAATAPKVKRSRKPRKSVVKSDPVIGTGTYVRTALDALADNAADPIGRGLWVA